MRRKAAVAGLFYADDLDGLRRQIEGAFRHKLGPGKIPDRAPQGMGRVRALVVPHAGYVYSGPVAAHAYAALADAGVPERVIVVGPNHTGVGTMADYSTEDFETPLGVLANAGELTRRFRDTILSDNPAAHAREHSVEVQLPFLQELRPDLRFAPVLLGMQDEETAREVGEIIAAAVEAEGDTLLVASADLSHVGPQYEQQAPPGERVDRFVRRQDAFAVERIARLDPAGLVDVVRQREVSSCGYGAVAAVLFAAKRLGATRARQLAYATSYDVAPHHSCVGYASFAVE